MVVRQDGQGRKWYRKTCSAVLDLPGFADPRLCLLIIQLARQPPLDRDGLNRRCIVSHYLTIVAVPYRKSNCALPARVS
jgi:hypothetical protein